VINYISEQASLKNGCLSGSFQKKSQSKFLGESVERVSAGYKRLKITKERYFTKCDYPKIWVKQIRERRIYPYEECVKFIDLLGIKNQERVLEVGTGEGRLIPLVTRKGGQYVGIDVSKDMFKYARDNIKGCSADFVLCEAKFLPFREKVFSKSFCYATMFFIPNQEKAIKEIVRVCEAKVLVELRNRFSPYVLGVWLFDNQLRIRDRLRNAIVMFLLCPFTRSVAERILQVFYGKKMDGLVTLASECKNIRELFYLPQIPPYFPLTPLKILRILRGLQLESFMVSFFDHGQIVNGKKWFLKSFLIVDVSPNSSGYNGG
jgi:ubiquinone/menaquinone biosynthesis C-methylase UbiE